MPICFRTQDTEKFWCASKRSEPDWALFQWMGSSCSPTVQLEERRSLHQRALASNRSWTTAEDHSKLYMKDFLFLCLQSIDQKSSRRKGFPQTGMHRLSEQRYYNNQLWHTPCCRSAQGAGHYQRPWSTSLCIYQCHQHRKYSLCAARP